MPKSNQRRSRSQAARHHQPVSYDTTTTLPMPNLLEAAKPAIDMGGEIARAWGSIGEEMLEFRSNRMHKMLDAASRLRQARDLSEAIGVQTEFARDLFRDYLSESGKVSDVWMQSLSRGFSASRQALQRTTDAVIESAEHA